MAETLGAFFGYVDATHWDLTTALWHFFGKGDAWDTVKLDGVEVMLSLLRFWYQSGRLFFPGLTARQQAFELWYIFTAELDQSTEPP